MSEERCTGRTTSLILHALANAIDARGHEVSFIDHDATTQRDADYAVDVIRERCETLGLWMQVKRRGYRVILRSTLVGIKRKYDNK